MVKKLDQAAAAIGAGAAPETDLMTTGQCGSPPKEEERATWPDELVKQPLQTLRRVHSSGRQQQRKMLGLFWCKWENMSWKSRNQQLPTTKELSEMLPSG